MAVTPNRTQTNAPEAIKARRAPPSRTLQSEFFVNTPLSKSRGRQMDCITEKQKLKTLPALVEDDSESESFEEQERTYIPYVEGLRSQKSISPQRRVLRRQLALPSLSEDEEP
ncbi:hypothetical protein KGM_216110 [Danaus plexippus plexippus]|uniref:Uncharacterized protein n=1 Tax=Danaus plexippus plexippus TaxID=278856 RepID=A0A212F358_DANPL|nr:hypothetical protein KGM_216110 [Danaus plexippus plexippus]